MARLDPAFMLYAKKKSKEVFNYDALVAPPLLSLLSPYDINTIDMITTDPRLDSKLRERKNLLDQLLKQRGFIRFASGTNRVVYKFLEDQSFLLKVAISSPGIRDSAMEYRNQSLLKPFCAKCFEVSSSGAIGLFERVETINTVQQYLGVADDHFKLLHDNIIGKYIMADVGSKFWMNLGIRVGFGLVFVDYPMIYELDGKKLYCNSKVGNGIPCGGLIDYDDGYNFIYCTKCGKQYPVSRLAKREDAVSNKFFTGKGKIHMKFSINNGKSTIETLKTVDTYLDDKQNINPEKVGSFKAQVISTIKKEVPVEDTEREEQEEEMTDNVGLDIYPEFDSNDEEIENSEPERYEPKQVQHAPFSAPEDIKENEEDASEISEEPSKYDNY